MSSKSIVQNMIKSSIFQEAQNLGKKHNQLLHGKWRIQVDHKEFYWCSTICSIGKRPLSGLLLLTVAYIFSETYSIETEKTSSELKVLETPLILRAFWCQLHSYRDIRGVVELASWGSATDITKNCISKVSKQEGKIPHQHGISRIHHGTSNALNMSEYVVCLPGCNSQDTP